MTSIESYAARIHAPEDRPLFVEAVKSAEGGALRASFIMLWLSCAESLKRKFREAQKRDGGAGKIVGEIEKKEGEQKSVDKFVLEKAKEYGFISVSAHTILMNVYELRCVYGHPYEEAPTEEQVTHAAAMVVDHVLSQPVRLRQGFGKSLINSLLQDKNYLDEQAQAVEAFVSGVLPKIDERIHGWLLDTYWKELEKIADDPSLRPFFHRGLWFTRAFLSAVGPVFSEDEWHSRAVVYPKTLIRALDRNGLFMKIGTRGQDTLVGAALDLAGDRAGVLKYLERLNKAGTLSERQQARFREHVEEMPIAKIRSAKLSTKSSFDRVIGEMKSHNWYRQQPVVDLVIANGPDQVAELDVADRVILGRNFLQVADGDERSAKRFLGTLAEDPSPWPASFIRGIVLECFVNEDNKVRLKCDRLKTVLSILERMDKGVRGKIVEKVRAAISQGEAKEVYLGRETFKDVCKTLGGYGWAEPIKLAVEEMEEQLVPSRDDD